MLAVHTISVLDSKAAVERLKDIVIKTPLQFKHILSRRCGALVRIKLQSKRDYEELVAKRKRYHMIITEMILCLATMFKY